MPLPSTPHLPIDALRAAFGSALQEGASLSGYTTARAGGPADALLVAGSAGELEQIVHRLWELDAPFTLLGYGSNVLVADSGLHHVVVLNRARKITFDDAGASPSGASPSGASPSVWAESGALIGTIARQAGLRGLGGFEWAATVPGTLGGAVYGNAGAFGGDMHASLLVAEILQPTGKELWPVERLQYQYRSSVLKREHEDAKMSPQALARPDAKSRPNAKARPSAVILSARLKLEHSDPQTVQEKMESFSARRRGSQPPGASLGSMFKNPPGDYAGRLIEAAGLKGTRVGGAEISAIHANFFVNYGQASAADIGELIRIARETVAEKFGVQLELEVELLGDWSTVLTEKNNSGAKADHER